MRKTHIIAAALMLIVVACSSETTTTTLSYCEASAATYDLGAPADQKDTADQAREAMANWRNSAPDEIAESVALFADRWLVLLEIWEAADFDRDQIDEAAFDSAFEAFFSETTSLADDEFTAWEDANCTA